MCLDRKLDEFVERIIRSVSGESETEGARAATGASTDGGSRGIGAGEDAFRMHLEDTAGSSQADSATPADDEPSVQLGFKAAHLV